MVANNSQSNVRSSQEYKAVNDYLSGHVKAQDQFCERVETEFTSTQNAEDVESLLWSAWNAVIETAKDVSDAQKRQKLVDFVLSLQQRPTLKKGDTVCQVWDSTVWSDLPVFGAEVRECWNTTVSDSSTIEEQQQWLNINAFVATLVATAHNHADKPDFTLYAVWALRDAFEQQKPSKTATEAAATWLICASHALSDLTKSQKTFDGKLARAGSLYQDNKQWTGFNSDRWSAWMSKLNESNASELGGRGEDLIAQAKQKTVALE